MIAMVMCAGLGTRLRPLTYELPKPIMPLVGKPALSYTLENLRRHGILEVVVNVSYMAEKIQAAFGDGSKLGMKIHWSIENEPMGTAGGVKKAEHIFMKDGDDSFIVTSGDGLTDISFSQLLAFHKKKRAFATIALKDVDGRFDYGITMTGPGGRIQKFIEKPTWSSVYSCWVNTGIYVFSKKIFNWIPKNQFYDFGMTLWPILLKKKLPIFGYKFSNFWTDIGNVEEYKSAQKAILDHKVQVAIEGKEVKPGVWLGKRSKLHPKAKVEAPVWIGEDCTIEKNATMRPYSVIGNRSKIVSGAEISQSVLWGNVTAQKNVLVERSVVGTSLNLDGKIALLEGTVLNPEMITGR